MKIVQIGSNSGYDELTKYIYEHKNEIEFLLLVEPLDIFNNSLNECYRDIDMKYIENVVITDGIGGEVNIYMNSKMDTSYAQTSVLESHIYKHFNGGDLLVKRVNSLNVNTLFKMYNLYSIHYLFIDAEGMDDRIIRNIEFDKFDIDMIYYETSHIDRVSLNSFLQTKEYTIFDYDQNSLAIKTNKLRFLKNK